MEAVDLRLVQTDEPDIKLDRRLSEAVEVLAAAVEMKDAGTGGHIYRTAILASACLEQVDPHLAAHGEINYAFLLHDIGKIGVPDSILNKPGPLDADEWNIMRRHPEMGAKLIVPLGFDDIVTDVILHHHERWDGSGYPFGLHGEDIPLPARVLAVADAYDAMTCERPYSTPVEMDDALTIIELSSDKHFDPEVVDVFLKIVI
ncbi:MAG: HD-GYP domain-containing protein [Actinomycetota bacterium]